LSLSKHILPPKAGQSHTGLIKVFVPCAGQKASDAWNRHSVIPGGNAGNRQDSRHFRPCTHKCKLKDSQKTLALILALALTLALILALTLTCSCFLSLSDGRIKI